MSKHLWFKTEIVFLVSAEFISWVFSLQGRKKRICVEQLFAKPYEKSCVEKVKINFICISWSRETLESTSDSH